MRYGELESVEGTGYLVTLDDGLPRISLTRQLRFGPLVFLVETSQRI
jgi:hypothetical protein